MEPFSGLTCPKCGSCRLSVTQTVQGHNSVIRRRKCAQGHSFITEEVVSSSDKYNEWAHAHMPGRHDKIKAP